MSMSLIMHAKNERVANGIGTTQDMRWNRAEDQTTRLLVYVEND